MWLQGQVSVSASKALAAEALSERYQDIRALIKLLTKLTQGDWQQEQEQGWRGRGGAAAAVAGAEGQPDGEGVDVAQARRAQQGRAE